MRFITVHVNCRFDTVYSGKWLRYGAWQRASCLLSIFRAAISLLPHSLCHRSLLHHASPSFTTALKITVNGQFSLSWLVPTLSLFCSYTIIINHYIFFALSLLSSATLLSVSHCAEWAELKLRRFEQEEIVCYLAGFVTIDLHTETQITSPESLKYDCRFSGLLMNGGECSETSVWAVWWELSWTAGERHGVRLGLRLHANHCAAVPPMHCQPHLLYINNHIRHSASLCTSVCVGITEAVLRYVLVAVSRPFCDFSISRKQWCIARFWNPSLRLLSFIFITYRAAKPPC